MQQTGTKVVDDPSSGFIDEDTVFWLCSQTKMITTIAALKLIEQGKIELDTPVEQILPELVNPVIVTGLDDAGNLLTTPAKLKITFGQLLNHTSGLDYYVDGTTPASGMPLSYSHSYKGEDVSVFFKILKGSLPGVPLKFEPGTDFGYGFSNDCAGFIIERLSGKSLEEYFQEYIFAPLGIKSASFYLTPALKERLLPLSSRNADGTIETLGQHSYIDQDPANVTVHLGGVGLYSSQKDYLAILRHLLQIKSGRATDPILTLASVNKMFEPTLPPAGAATAKAMAAIFSKYLGLPAGAAQFSRGLLFNTEDVPGKRRKGSGAWGGWANTSFFVDPTTGVAAVFATQLIPASDDKHEQMFSLLEKTLYAGLKA
ncbi:beta-lactamase/transpeptidase-like protein [Mycena rosella]|uniref:Beta-lactamase/transpeptidase-like protein n=1 Tax=Mycena rosella TaxID=1033263 RepID=A0AAD7GI54_MYCRO|nr:beta-lactamase/transpeptidase-like protein [Mycena rosella]